MVTQISSPKEEAKSESQSKSAIVISWEALPDNFQLEDDPVESIVQPLLAGALRESYEIKKLIQPSMLIASNFGLCATINGQLTIKAPDWVYVTRTNEIIQNRKSYTPNLEGEVPAVVMEFLSDSQDQTPGKGDEYSSKQTHPLGKWFFYEQILQIPIYVIFDPDGGLLEFYRLENGYYKLELPDENGRHWIEAMGLFLGTWQGEKEGRTGYWLRWWDADSNILPWAVENADALQQIADSERLEKEQALAKAQQERLEKEQERQRTEEQRLEKEQALQQAEEQRLEKEQALQQVEEQRLQKERLIAYLQSQGLDPNNLPPLS